MIRYTRSKDGARIAYSKSKGGTGTRVLFIDWPGLVTMATVGDIPPFVACGKAARAGRPFAAFDWRGLGYSGPIGERLTLEEQIMDIEAVCDAVGEPMDAIAWCTAAFAAVPLAVRRPELFRTLVLVAPDYEGTDSHYDAFETMRYGLSEVEWLLVAIRRRADVSPAVARAAAQRLLELAPSDAARAHMRAFRESSLDGVVQQLTVPTAVLSHPESLRQSSRVAEAIPNCIFELSEELTYASHEGGEIIRRAIDALHSASSPQISFAIAGEAALVAGIARPKLSRRECEVLSCLAAGRGNAEIASLLALSTRTVERHVQNIYNKLGVRNRVEAAHWAARNGMISAP